MLQVYPERVSNLHKLLLDSDLPLLEVFVWYNTCILTCAFWCCRLVEHGHAGADQEQQLCSPRLLLTAGSSGDARSGNHSKPFYVSGFLLSNAA